MKILLTVCFMLLLLSGCSVLQSMNPDTRQLAFTYATAKAINGDQERADRVIELVERGREFVERSDSVTISALYEGVRERINWQGLDPADQILISAILTTARDRLNEEVGVGALDESQRLRVLTVLDWIEGAARGYVS
jgi:hypothetical protein